MATSPGGRTKRQRHAKAATKKATRREEDVAGSDAQCLVRWKDTWEPAANLSLSCLARWDAEQQERERRTATTATTTTTTTPRKRGRPKGVKNKAASPLRPRAKKNEERQTRVGKRKREDEEDSEEENENENEEEEGEEEEKNEEREEEHEEEEEEEEEARVRVAREGLGASPLLAHNFERLRKRKRSRLKDSLTLPTRQPDLPPPRGDEEAEADEEQQLDGVFDHPAGFAPAWFPHTVPCYESTHAGTHARTPHRTRHTTHATPHTPHTSSMTD